MAEHGIEPKCVGVLPSGRARFGLFDGRRQRCVTHGGGNRRQHGVIVLTDQLLDHRRKCFGERATSICGLRPQHIAFSFTRRQPPIRTLTQLAKICVAQLHSANQFVEKSNERTPFRQDPTLTWHNFRILTRTHCFEIAQGERRQRGN